MGNGKDKLRRIRDLLGKPSVEDDYFLIYNCDCLAAMQRMPSGVIDLTVTSPPYNIGKEYEAVLSLEDYLSWCEKWISEIYRVTEKSGAFWLNLGYLSIPNKANAIPLPYLLWNKSPFFLMQEVVWNYGAGVAAKKFLSPRNEKFLWYVKDSQDYVFNLDDIRDPDVKYPKQKKNGKLRCNTIGKNPSDVWQIAKVTSGKNRSSKERAPHPAQFPLDLIDRIIVGFSNPGDLVFDPFLGSGTTAESCLKNKRYSLGFEINQDYNEYVAYRLGKRYDIPQILIKSNDENATGEEKRAEQLILFR